jgi:hypothetical protein
VPVTKVIESRYMSNIASAPVMNHTENRNSQRTHPNTPEVKDSIRERSEPDVLKNREHFGYIETSKT